MTTPLSMGHWKLSGKTGRGPCSSKAALPHGNPEEAKQKIFRNSPLCPPELRNPKTALLKLPWGHNGPEGFYHEDSDPQVWAGPESLSPKAQVA